MSTAEAPPRPAGVAPAGGTVRHGVVRPWLRMLRSELGLIFRRWRNLLLLAVLIGIPVLLGIALRVSVPPSCSRSRATGSSWRSWRSPSC